MSRLEELQPNASVQGILPNGLVTVVNVQWFGSEALELTFKDAAGKVANELLYRHDESRLEVVQQGRPWSFDGDGGLFRLAAEAQRIRLAHLFDPVLAVHTSVVEPLPHQITAVYEAMLPRQPLRFLLADDPGAGKTIMAGLLMKELIARGDLQRCLVVCPGSLAEQWQGELRRRFNLPFEILTNDKFESSRTGNWFLEANLVIARLDKLKSDESLQQKLQAPDCGWDLIVCDEAHKLSATLFGNEVKYTKRYRLAQLLSSLTRHFLLMTATPHNGKEADFQLFMALLDQDRFEGSFREKTEKADVSDLMRRMVKESLLKFDAKPLFPERIAYTVPYKLSEPEEGLYIAVTEYVRALLSGQVETISQKSLIFCGFPGKIGWCRFQLILALFGGFPRGWPMNTGKTIFAQLMDFLPWSNFARIVGRYGGDQRVRTLSCAEQYRAMAFAQLTYRESLRDIETCLSVQASKLYFMGFREPVRRSTLADANETRDWRIYAELAQRLIVQARKLYVNEDLGLDLSNTVYALDSTTIDLCLSVFPWAHFRTTKAAVKMHTLLDLRGSIPSFIHVSDGKLHDVHALDLLLPEAGAIYVMDRGYVDFARLYTLHQAGAFFVTRAKSNMDARRVYSDLVDRTSGIICDQSIALNGFYAGQNYPEKLRRIRFKDADSGKTLVFLSNNFALPALTIADLYRNRWQVELFFKWIKQHLRIKQFFGTSENAVKTQIWIAVSVYVLVAIVKKRLGLEASLYTLLQIFSVTLFEKIPIEQALSLGENRYDHEAADNQLNLFAS